MKAIMFAIIFIFSMTVNAKDIGHSEGDTIACMRQIVCDSLSFKGKAVGEVFKRFKADGIQVRSISLGGTSPWIDPEGRRYINRITISFFTDDEIVYRVYQERPFAVVVIYTDGSKMTIEEAMSTFSIRNRSISIEEKLNMLAGMFSVKHLHFVFMFNDTASLPFAFYNRKTK